VAAGSPENPTPETEETPTPESSPQIAALENRIEQLQGLVEKQGDATGQVGQLIQGLQAQMGQLAPQQAPETTPEPSETFQKFYSDIDGYIEERAVKASREAMGPHLAHQAVQTRDALLEQAQTNLDTEHGEGFWDTYIKEPLTNALVNLPLEMQSSQPHVEAALKAAVGNVYLNPEHRSDMESRRSKAAKAREEAMNNLPTGRGAPPRGDRLDDRQRTFLDSLERSGISFTESEYKTAMNAGGTIDEWRAAKAAASKKK
jgi:hypothetical protein